MRVQDDLRSAIRLDAENALLYYNLATVYIMQKDYNTGIDLFSRAIQLNPNLAEAYFNLGLARIFAGHKAEGIRDLSKAGELGLYDAYSVMKRYSETK
jgi:tetratricopeptide (TPR) repeat protein